MRYLTLALALMALPATAAAQAGAPPLQPIPVPQIGLGSSLFTNPPRGPHADPFPEPPKEPRARGEHQPRPEPRFERHPSGPRPPHVRPPGNVWVVPGYVWGATAAPASSVVTEAPEPPVLEGWLSLSVEPSSLLQVFVDGVFVGSGSDVARDVKLPTGTRHVEFRAPGYQTLSVDVQIVASRTITYRNALVPVAPQAPPPAPEPAAPPVALAPSTLYVIPGCYLGNVMPRADRLREGCDLARLRILPPDRQP